MYINDLIDGDVVGVCGGGVALTQREKAVREDRGWSRLQEQ